MSRLPLLGFDDDPEEHRHRSTDDRLGESHAVGVRAHGPEIPEATPKRLVVRPDVRSAVWGPRV